MHQDLLIHTEAGVTTITFNRVDKKNSITTRMYAAMADALAAADEAVADEGCKNSPEDPRRHRRIIEVIHEEGRLHIK